MLIDSGLLFDGSYSAGGVLSGAAITTAWANPATPGNYNSTNVIDTSQLAATATAQGRDIGIGDDLILLVVATVSIVGAANSTLEITLQAAPDSGSGTPGSYVPIASSPLYAVGTGGIAAGTELFRIPLPVSLAANQPKFYNLQYTVGTANITSGSVLSAIIIDRQALGPKMGYASAIPTGTTNYM